VTAAGNPTGVMELAERIGTAVSGCPGVVRLAGGPIATYLPRRTVHGVAVRDDQIVVAVVARYGSSLPDVASEIREAVGRVIPDRPVTVHIEDVEDAGEIVEGDADG
jgi:uncharacterized alkaline shock family protein YloU